MFVLTSSLCYPRFSLPFFFCCGCRESTKNLFGAESTTPADGGGVSPGGSLGGTSPTLSSSDTFAGSGAGAAPNTTSGIPALVPSRSFIELGLSMASTDSDKAEADAGRGGAAADVIAGPVREWLLSIDVTNPMPQAYAHNPALSRPPRPTRSRPTDLAAVTLAYRDLVCLLDLLPVPELCAGVVRERDGKGG